MISIGKRGKLATSVAVVAAGLLGGAIIHAAGPGAAALPAYLGAFPGFAPGITAQMPGDVDVGLKTSLESAKKFAEVQREFDLYSWQMFFALAWPTDAQGRAAPSLTDTGFGSPRWTLWHNSSAIFTDKGTRPATCATPGGPRMLTLTRDLSQPVSRGLKAFSAKAIAGADPRKTRFLGVMSAVGEINAANLGDIQQAFTGR